MTLPPLATERLAEIEQVLKRDPCPEYRRQVIREYHDIYEAIEKAKNNG